MARLSFSIGMAALVAAAVVVPSQAQAEHENRYFGFSAGYLPFTYPYPYYPPPAYARPPVYAAPPVYAPPPRVRQVRPGVYEYEMAPGRWVRARPGYGYRPPGHFDRRVRAPIQGPPPLPQSKPDPMDQPRVAERSAPTSALPAERARNINPGDRMSCEAAADIIRDFGFSDVQPISCSGDIYDFQAARDGSDFAIKLSAGDGELTEVRRR